MGDIVVSAPEVSLQESTSSGRRTYRQDQGLLFQSDHRQKDRRSRSTQFLRVWYQGKSLGKKYVRPIWGSNNQVCTYHDY